MDFARRALQRIIFTGLFISLGAGAIAWFMAVENAERESVDLAMDVTRDTIKHFGLMEAKPERITAVAEQVTQSLVLDWFDIVELYDVEGRKLSESLTENGRKIENELPHHDKPESLEPAYESIKTVNDGWVLRIFVPIETQNPDIWGYVEGVRVVPDWQKADIRHYSLMVALLSMGAVWLCALVIYPTIVYLNREHIRQSNEILKGNIDMMLALGKAIALRDSDTGAHNYRVVWMAVEIAEKVSLDTDQIKALILGSYLHDVGKIAISDTIMLKPGRLDENEMAIMKTHVEEGVRMVEGIKWLESAAPVIGSHHEKWDGSGYPKQLSGETIPLNARIFAIADVFDALCSERPYKKPFSYQEALNIIKEGRGSHFDPCLVDLFEGQARRFYDQLVGLDEVSCHRLIQHKIDRYFFGLS